ncbi:MAG: MBL fold metallo-hydrolase [Pseudomonadota bacterium]
MKPLALGDITITRVVEREAPHLPIVDLFAGAEVDLLAPHRSWLEPHFITSDNRLIHSFHCFVVRTPRLTILVDTCIGNDKVRPEAPIFHMRNGTFLEDLARQGVRPEDVDFVMCTHMHVDHVGWNTRLENGRWVPTFPNAKYLFGRKEWEFWRQQYETNGPELWDGSIGDSVVPIVEADAHLLVDSDHQIDDAIWLSPSPGHTPGHFCVNIRRGGRRALMTGDVFHNAVQCARPEWNSIYCSDADQARATRRSILETFGDTDTAILPAHFASPTCGRFVSQGLGSWRYDVSSL